MPRRSVRTPSSTTDGTSVPLSTWEVTTVVAEFHGLVNGRGFGVLADHDTGQLLGAHILGSDAFSIIQPLIQAMSFSQDARDVARQQY
jgi:pyruvate/2-oxoglutarate dehydrogenase complex dihydrolipoamide dehydrogenase (E3) component